MQKNLIRAGLIYNGPAFIPGMRYNWQVRSKNPGGLPENASSWSALNYFTYGSLTGIINNEIPGEYKLSQNYPNPFNPSTVIEFEIPLNKGSRGLFVNLTIYDLLGREVSTLVNESKNPGKYSVDFNGSNLSSGIYFYRLNVFNSDGSLSFTDIKRMIMIK